MKVYFAGKGWRFRRSSGYAGVRQEDYSEKRSERFRPCQRPRGALSRGAERRAINAPGAAMTAWIVWLIVAAVLGVAELLTTTFALGILAVAALVAAGVGAAHLGVPLQLTAFVVASGAGLGFVLPVARRHVRQPPLLRTGPAALIGRS